MDGLISLENLALQPVSKEIFALNEVSSQYGLTLNEEEAGELSQTRSTALIENERVEIGVGAVEKLIRRFCASRYVTAENYAYVLNELTYLFYYIKTETDDGITDGALIDELFTRFELFCRGSIDLLESREAEKIIRKVNSGAHYAEWYRERDELDRREGESEYEEQLRRLREDGETDGSGEETSDPFDPYEEDADYDPEEEDGYDLDAFDEFFDREAAMQNEADPHLAEEDPDDPDEEDEEDD